MVALRKEQSAITERPVASQSGNEYKLYFYEDKLKGCSCNWRRFHPREECKHMQRHRDEQRTAYNNFCLAMGI